MCLGILCMAVMVVPVFAGLTDAILGWIAHMMQQIVSGMLTNDTLAVFSQVPAELEQGKDAWAVVSTVNQNIIRPFAYSLVGLCFTIRLAQMVTDYERMLMTPERFFGPILQMIATMFLVSQSFFITEQLLRIGVQLAVEVHNNIISLLGNDVQSLFNALMTNVKPDEGGLVGGFVDTVVDAFNGKLWQAVVAALALLLPWFISVVIGLLTKIAAYGVIIELLVRAAFVPLFAGDVMLHGFEGRGFNVLKGFMAACCQGAVFVLIAGIVNAMNWSALAPPLQHFADTGDIFKVIGQMASSALVACIYSGAGLALMLKSSEIVKSVFGE